MGRLFSIFGTTTAILRHVLILLTVIKVCVSQITVPTKGPGTSRRCWTCASVQLYDKWWSTSFVRALPSLLYDDRCRGESTMVAWSYSPEAHPNLMMACDTACVSMIIHLPEVADAGSDLIVRGCLAYLLNDETVDVQEETCSRGEYNRFEPWSFTIKKHETFDYCTTDLCNTVTAYTNPCKSPEDDQGIVQLMECVECQIWAEWDSCEATAGTCTGKYCYKKVGWMGDTYMDMRGCAPFSPYANMPSQCYDIDTTMSIVMYTSVQVGYGGTQCYCNDQDSCNTAAYSSPSIHTVITTVCLCLIAVVLQQW